MLKVQYCYTKQLYNCTCLGINTSANDFYVVNIDMDLRPSVINVLSVNKRTHTWSGQAKLILVKTRHASVHLMKSKSFFVSLVTQPCSSKE